jgi:hypothetical protein
MAQDISRFKTGFHVASTPTGRVIAECLYAYPEWGPLAIFSMAAWPPASVVVAAVRTAGREVAPHSIQRRSCRRVPAAAAPRYPKRSARSGTTIVAATRQVTPHRRNIRRPVAVVSPSPIRWSAHVCFCRRLLCRTQL